MQRKCGDEQNQQEEARNKKKEKRKNNKKNRDKHKLRKKVEEEKRLQEEAQENGVQDMDVEITSTSSNAPLNGGQFPLKELGIGSTHLLVKISQPS